MPLPDLPALLRPETRNPNGRRNRTTWPPHSPEGRFSLFTVSYGTRYTAGGPTVYYSVQFIDAPTLSEAHLIYCLRLAQTAARSRFKRDLFDLPAARRWKLYRQALKRLARAEIHYWPPGRQTDSERNILLPIT